jgi:hypothetical protein
LAGKSTLNRLELGGAEATRYHKISHDPAAIESLFVTLFLEATRRRRPRLRLISTRQTIRSAGIRKGGSSTATMIAS